MRRPALVCALSFLLCAPAAAIVGGADEVRGSGPGAHVVMVIGSRGNLCTGTALRRDLVLTAAHCVAPAAKYLVLLNGVTYAPRTIAVNPRYKATDYAGGRVTADVALIKLEAMLPDSVRPAALAESRAVAAGDRFTIAGFGATKPRDEKSIGVARSAALVATGKPGNLQIRLVDPDTRGERPGLGACTGDSGGPAFVETDGRYTVIGVVSWSTGPSGTEGCGGLTGLTPLTLHRGWIIDTAKRLGSPISR